MASATKKQVKIISSPSPQWALKIAMLRTDWHLPENFIFFYLKVNGFLWGPHMDFQISHMLEN